MELQINWILIIFILIYLWKMFQEAEKEMKMRERGKLKQ